jgi:hypothetical protein
MSIVFAKIFCGASRLPAEKMEVAGRKIAP